MKSWKPWVVVMVASSCGLSDSTPGGTSDSIEITEHNALGVTELVTERVMAPDESIFRVRGLDASGNEVALVQQRIGTIPNLREHLPGKDDFGAELDIKIGERTWNAISREVHASSIPTLEGSAGYREFFGLSAVELALKSANIEIVHPKQHAGLPERAFDTMACEPTQLLSSVGSASQCCTNDTNSGTLFHSTTMGPNYGLVVARYYSPYGPCKSATGGTCSGTSCYYGPYGYSMAQVWSNSSTWNINTYIHSWTENWEVFYESYCGANYDGGEIQFPDVTGTLPAQNCPGGDSGDGSAWEY